MRTSVVIVVALVALTCLASRSAEAQTVGERVRNATAAASPRLANVTGAIRNRTAGNRTAMADDGGMMMSNTTAMGNGTAAGNGTTPRRSGASAAAGSSMVAAAVAGAAMLLVL